jgi:hypothetical protein
LLYEGYILYPYRPSAVKNRQRWTFGGVLPEDYVRTHATGDAASVQTQCLVCGTAATRLDLRLRFLQVVEREVAALDPVSDLPADAVHSLRRVAALDIDGRPYAAWQEAVEREVRVSDCALGAVLARPHRVAFTFPGGSETEGLRRADGLVAGALVRTWQMLAGELTLGAESVGRDAWRLTVLIRNLTPFDAGAAAVREAALPHAFVSTHTILGVEQGEFVSLLEPPAVLAGAAAACRNLGTYPVLVGAEGCRDTLLSSPIILYDYPQVAPESAGDLFDATEIDEILTLRILAMTDAEKREMASADAHARAILERSEALGAEGLRRLHGALRRPRPAEGGPRLAAMRHGGRALRVGDAVRISPRPGPGGDIWDLVLAGRTGVIEAIEQDFEDRVHVAVTVDDDPGRDLGLERMPGHRFFFSPEEIEPLSSRLEVRT